MKQEQPIDFKRVVASEGKSLPDSWSWFRDADVLKSFTDACLEIVESKDFLEQHPEKKVSVLGIGSGTAIVEHSLKKVLESHGYTAEITASDILGDVIRNAAQKADLAYLQMDNKAMPLADNSLDLVVARSVLQYEATEEDKNRVLREIQRVLKDGGYFIDQAPVFATPEESELVARVYALLPKELSLETKTGAMALRAQFFSDIKESTAQARPLILDKTMLFKRYNLDKAAQEQLVIKAIELIGDCAEGKHPNVIAGENRDDFTMRIPFTTYLCKK